MTFPAHAFRYAGLQNDCGDYRDHVFTDTSPNRLRRHWVVTYPRDPAEPCTAVLQRAETDEDSFDIDVKISRTMIEGLVSLVPIWTGTGRPS